MQDARRHSFHFRSFHPSRLHSRALVAKAVDILPRDDSASSSSSPTDPNADNGRSHKLLVAGLILGFFGVIIIGVILYWTKRMNLTERRKYMERLDEPRPTMTSPSKRRVSSKMETERKEGLARNGSTSSTSSQPETQNHRVSTRQKSLGRSLSTSTRHLLRSASTSSTNLLNSSSNLLRSASSSSTNLLRSKTFAKAKESNSLAAKITPFSLTDGNYGSHTNLPGQLDNHLREGAGGAGGDPGAIDGYGHGPRFIHTPGENMRIATRLENGVWVFSDPKRTRGGLLGNMGNDSQVSLVSGGAHVRRHTADPFSLPSTPIDADGNERGSPFADPPFTTSAPSLPRHPPTAAIGSRPRPTLPKAYSSNNVLDVQQAQRGDDVSRSASPSGSIYSLYDYGGDSGLPNPSSSSLNAKASSSSRAPPPSSFPRNININTNIPPRPSSRSSMLSVSSYTHASHSPSNAYAQGIQGIDEPLSESIPRSKPRSASVLLEMQREERERRSRHLSRGSLGGGSVLGASLTGGVIHGTPYAYDGDRERWDGNTTEEGNSGWTEEPDEMSDFTHSDIHSYAYSQSAYTHSQAHSDAHSHSVTQAYNQAQVRAQVQVQAPTKMDRVMSEAERERERERRLREDIERYRRGGGTALKVDTNTNTNTHTLPTPTPTTATATSAYASVFTPTATTPTTPYTPYTPYTPSSTNFPLTSPTSAVPTSSLIRKPSKARVPVSVSLDLGDPTSDVAGEYGYEVGGYAIRG